MKKNIILIFLILVMFACSKEDNVIRTSDMSVPQITGFELRNEIGIMIKILGSPNNKLGDKQSFEQSDYYFIFYPNPSKNVSSLFIKTPNNSDIKHIWIVQAQYDNTIPDYSIDNSMINFMVGGTPMLQFTTTDSNLTIDFEDIPNGYYRIYVQIGDILLYDNIIIYK